MTRIESSVLIHAPVREVFAYAADWQKWSDWFEGVSNFRPTAQVTRGNGASFARNTAESDARRAPILALFVYDAIGFVVMLLVRLAGVLNPPGWFVPALYLFFTVGFGYLAIWSVGAPKSASTLPAHP